MKNIKIILIVIASIWLLGKCTGCGDDAISSTDTQTIDYSWIYGTWKININSEETQVIRFLEDGTYTSQYRFYYGGVIDETGSYNIQSSSNRIKLDCGDGYPSYIEIEDKRLKDYNSEKYYNKL